MQTFVIPVLILATVALSSSNVLPILSMNEQNGEPLDYQNDNTFNNKQHTKDNLNAILLNVDIEPEFENSNEYNLDADNNDLNSISKNYNMKGFRKAQWHNYPRQLDRLNRYFFDHSSDKRNLDPDDPDDAYIQENTEIVKDDMTSNEFLPDNDPDIQKIRNEAEVAAAVINPLLIFRIHLACYNKDLEVLNQDHYQQKDAEQDANLLENNNVLLEPVNPESSLPKVKREGKMNSQDNETVQKSSKNRTMKKRIFSLWSRLQSLNHKGHELHHRRHLYALYGLPDSEGGGGGGVLTAETRATFMRPPGSPLRWG